MTINNNEVAFDADFMIENAMDRIIFQQVSQSLDVAKIVYCNNLNLRIIECNTENLAADTAKKIGRASCRERV